MTEDLTESTKKKILAGGIFIYPTDTLYGIGCDASNQQAVEKIREIKGRDSKPFSVIAPSFDWIEEHLIIDNDLDLKKYLPGAYTIILKKKDTKFLSWVSPTDSLGVRIPNNNFCFQLQKLNIPIITTSVNFSGQASSLSLEEIPKEIKDKVDFIIESKETLSGKPSSLIINGKVLER